VKAVPNSIAIAVASFPEQLATVRELFNEYARSLEIDLCFQGFERELAELPGDYALPEGRLLLALEGEKAVGCVGLRKIAEGVCEMKRLYVRPYARRKGAGRMLAQAVIAAARQTGYRQLRLDTLSSMKEAIALYESLGFRTIPPYYHNPSGCAVFMELELY
jgi:putative acetyltransferase